MSRRATPPTVPVMLAGFSAFLALYSTQPLLPLLARTFGAGRLGVSLTVTAPSLAVALAAPVVGRLGERFGLRRTILGSAFALSGATFLASTATSLTWLIVWRSAQGLVTPGLFTTAIAFIHQEWPPTQAGRATGAYVSGTVIGGVTGRLLGGVVSGVAGWQASFLVLGAIGLGVAGLLWAWLPIERAAAGGAVAPGFSGHLRHRKLQATYLVGFCMLCSQVAMFTYVPFLLAAAPFRLSTAALGSIFLVYLLGAAVTPLAGHGVDRYGHRTVLVLALSLCTTGASFTLVPRLGIVASGLAVFATGIFFAQAASSSHVAHHAAEGRSSAMGLYTSSYYLGGSVGSALPSLLWNAGGWPACVAFIVTVQLAVLAIAWAWWGGSAEHARWARESSP